MKKFFLFCITSALLLVSCDLFLVDIENFFDPTKILNGEIATYTITFDANGGTGTMDSQSFTQDEAQTLTKNTYTRDGFGFAGWNTSSDGSGTSYSDEEMYTATANTVLYAVWTANIYTVTFNANGGSGTMDSQSYSHGVTQAFSKNAFTRIGYSFAGWNTEQYGTGIAYADEESYTANADLVLYARWKAHTYTVAFDANGGTGVMDVQSFTYDVLQNLTENSFTGPNGKYFAGWAIQKNASSADYSDKQRISNLSNVQDAIVTLYAVWSDVPVYIVTFNANNGSDNTTTQAFTQGVAEPLIFNSFYRTGYTFNGWNTTSDGSGATYAEGDNFIATKNTNLYAIWKINTYTVTFEVNGGSPLPEQLTVEYNNNIIEPVTPTMTGYTFVGWYKEDTFINQWNFTNDTVTNDITLYAKWFANAKVWLDGSKLENGSGTEISPFNSFLDAKTALPNGGTIWVTGTVSIDSGTHTWKSDDTVNKPLVLKRAQGFIASFVSVSGSGKLTIQDITLDGQGGVEVDFNNDGKIDAINDFIGEGEIQAEFSLVSVGEGGSLTIAAGTTLQNNKADEGGGIYVKNGATLNLSGNVQIHKNTLNNGTTPSNIAYQSGAIIQIVDALTGSIGISPHSFDSETIIATAIPSYTITEPDKDAFTLDSGNAAYVKLINNELVYLLPHNGPNFYVSEMGNVLGNGSQNYPFNNVQAAVDRIYSLGESDYIINVSGTITEEGTGSASNTSMVQINMYKTVHITLQGLDASNPGTIQADGIKRVLSISGTNTRVTLGDNLTITGGNNERGGGVYVASGTLNLIGGTISGNDTSGGVSTGGGVYMEKGIFNMTGGSISDNTANSGAGVYVSNGTFNMTGGSIRGNTAGLGSGGGCVVVNSGTFEMTGGTITGNKNTGVDVAKAGILKLGGSAVIRDNKYGGTIQSDGSILGGTPSNVKYYYSTTERSTVEIVEAFSPTAHIEITPHSRLSTDPIVATAGSTLEGVPYSLTGSEVDAFYLDVKGLDLNVSSNNLIAELTTTDYYVFENNADDTYEGTESKPLASVQEAVDRITSASVYLNASPAIPFTIHIKGRITQEGPVVNGDLADDGMVEIEGGGRLNLTLQGLGTGVNAGIIDAQGAKRTLYISTTYGTVTLGNNLTVTGGNADSYSYAAGGGVLVDYGTFIMTGGEISGNTSKGFGGGVSITNNASFEMTGGDIIGNISDSSGGGVYSPGTFIMEDGNISNNTATAGGGVYASSGTFTMENGTISGNTSTQTSIYSGGGGVYVGGLFEMTGGEITGNIAYGGGVFINYSGTLKIDGKAIINGNLYGSNEKNVKYRYVDSSSYGKIEIVGALDPTAQIGISPHSSADNTVLVTAGEPTVGGGVYNPIISSDLARFTRDDGGNLWLDTATNEIKTGDWVLISPDGYGYTVDSSGNVTITSFNNKDADVVIPDTIDGKPVTTIASNAFKENTDIQSVFIPDSITTIEKDAFLNATQLEGITISSSTNIGDGAFNGCGDIDNVYTDALKSSIPSNWEQANNGNFFGAEWLPISSNPANFNIIGGLIIAYNGSYENVVIPSVDKYGNDITSIANEAFEGNATITSVVIPDTVTIIGENSFGDCSGLTSVTIPDSVTTLGNGTFFNCSGLTSVAIPDSVTTIGSSTFFNCSGLTSVIIPDSVTSIGDAAFYGCSALTTVHTDRTKSSYPVYDAGPPETGWSTTGNDPFFKVAAWLPIP